MGISRACLEKVGGYKNMIGEDIDLSFRIKEAGFETRLFPDAYVYHKRRVDLRKFYRQVNTFGRGRILLNKLHPGSLKPVHLLPTAFALGNLLLVLLALVSRSAWWLLPIGIYVICIFAESLIKNKSLDVAFKSIAAAYVQLFGYGFGFISELLTHKASRATQEELYR